MTVIDSVSINGLRKTHFNQLLVCLDMRDREGWYFGNRKQFEKRHDELKAWLEEIIEALEIAK